MSEIYDITIIGGGPAGMFAGFYSGLRTAKVQIIESLAQLGGQVSALYPEKYIHDVAGFTGIKANDLIDHLHKQLMQLPVDVRLNETVTDLSKQTYGYQVVTNRGTYQTKAVITATGVGAFSPRRLAVEGAQELEDKHIFYTIPDPHHFQDKTVLIAGGGDSAIDTALMLQKVAKHVYLMHRRNQFRGMEHGVELLEKSAVELLTPYLLKKIEPMQDQLLLTMKEVKGEHLLQKQVDDVIVNYGFISNNKTIRQWQIQPEQQHRLFVVDRQMKTNLPLIYAIGDGVDYDGKLDLIATAFAEGPMAVSAIMKELYPNRRGPLHSTSMEL
ncbi:NAD(P)/FAD-dependent oxidoreductase [Pediococcus ethanolidurans]|uniref:NAD(P)/FAD-dependent oxidoreductase n=1 Tax=Pediococcus ethanolidurans TaxID=319653 RepID=UPI001C1EC1C4|nr:NAD(P)/FAD-dependent oxidoreductase [Pediococcus ethanolidurans]MBU7554570.1 NAD(P)/FAD-dependent oxidoreductase [Pediococcus ethanolidurans]MBU7562969.1 NAD(P)/FAD-dependent oxidoreductase [Pediococcus ethanolidurans]MCT4397275.1 NAD(P)/FAD-dependent oxidoreductase [Pediococcus ethanolidurans]MCV3314821.1 NAD(P)/FAD-dependent oxidoreductase [Pediococcus ethanolidurans]MCV3320946.1 NAD(P)/FAD-dependent oxidoreductase [Pediococcus ethanolidurans]